MSGKRQILFFGDQYNLFQQSCYLEKCSIFFLTLERCFVYQNIWKNWTNSGPFYHKSMSQMQRKTVIIEMVSFETFLYILKTVLAKEGKFKTWLILKSTLKFLPFFWKKGKDHKKPFEMKIRHQLKFFVCILLILIYRNKL